MLLHSGELRALLAGDSALPWLAASFGGDLTDIASTVAERDELPDGSPQATAAVAGVSALLTAADAQTYQTAARASGDSVLVTHVPTGGHFGVIAPGNLAWLPVRQVIRQAVGLPPQ